MTDPTEEQLRTALRERGSQIRPTPALPGILHRANASPDRAWHRWATVGAAAVASAGLVAAMVLFGPVGSSDAPVADPDRSVGVQPPPPGEPLFVPPATVVPVAMHFISPAGTLVGGQFEVTSSGDFGVDAAQVLIESEPPEPFVNGWVDDDESQRPRVLSVRRADDVITVDFDRPLEWVCPDGAGCDVADARLTIQQLVQTMQSVLRSSAPVQLTVDGEPATSAFGLSLDGPVAADPAVGPGIRVTSPAQGATVSSPVDVTGESTSFEGTVLWEVRRDGEVVADGYTTGGSMGTFAPFGFGVDLEPGEYTIALFEENAAGGAEGLARRLSPAYVDVTVR